MKKALLLLTILLVTIACKQEKKETIIAEVKGIPDGRRVILKKQVDGKVIGIDTTTVKNGKFGFVFQPEEPMVVGIFIDSIRQGIFPLIDVKDMITIKADKDSLVKAKITGSKLNDDLNMLRTFRDKQTASIMAKSDAFRKAQQEKDTATINKLNKEARAIQKVIAENEWKYVKTHPNSYVTPMVLGGFLRDPQYKDSVKVVFDNLSDKVKNSTIAKNIKKYFESEKVKGTDNVKFAPKKKN
ncbi:MAG TPA: DUF4369 domain-containing protein [Flavobacteriia bacterium]|nr:DUF4369 domain-containing protein [Flavobacteriia bacterium]